jgi:hypothetical protein
MISSLLVLIGAYRPTSSIQKNRKASKFCCWLNQVFNQKPIPEGIEVGFPNQYPGPLPAANLS